MSPEAHSDPAEQATTELGERIERLCLAYDRGDLEETLAAAGAEDLFLAAVAEIGADAPRAEQLRGLLDSLDEALTAVGLHGLTGSNRVFRTLPPFERPAEHVWVCPLRRCTRVETRDPGGRRCAVGSRRLERLTVE